MKRFPPMGLVAGVSLLLIVAGGCGRAADRSALSPDQPFSATLSTNVIHVGDLVTLTLKAVHPTPSMLEAPDLNRGKELVVRNVKKATQDLGRGMSLSTVEYTLTSFVITNVVVSTNSLRLLAQDGSVTRQEPFPFVPLQVESILTPSNTLYCDIKGLARWPSVLPRWLWGLGIVILIAVLASALLIHFVSKPRTILHYPPPLPPHVKALNALRELLARGWIESRQFEPFYVELSAIARGYIEERFGLHAPERTTEEFIREAAHSRLLSSEHQSLVLHFLEQSDLVKFARHQPVEDDMKAAFKTAEQLVMETAPAPKPNPEAGA